MFSTTANNPSLAHLNELLIHWVCQQLDIKAKILRASDLDLENSSGAEAIVQICQALNGTNYISGNSGKKYLKEGLFEEAQIRLSYFNVSSTQSAEGNLSVLHYLLTDRDFPCQFAASDEEII